MDGQSEGGRVPTLNSLQSGHHSTVLFIHRKELQRTKNYVQALWIILIFSLLAYYMQCMTLDTKKINLNYSMIVSILEVGSIRLRTTVVLTRNGDLPL